jgi:hypothetical protein
MKKKGVIFIFFVILLIAFISGCVEESEKKIEPKDGDEEIFSEEAIEGKYDPILESGKIYINGTWHNYTAIRYKKDGIDYKAGYLDHIIHPFDWLKNYTENDSTILCWWDYGGMIEGYSDREAIAVYPPLSLLDTIGMYNEFDEEGKERYITEHDFSEEGKIKDIASVLTAENFSNESVQDIIEKYNVSYIFTRSYDKKLAGIFLSAAGKEISEYFTDCEDKGPYCFRGTPTDKLNETLIYKMWEAEPDIPGLIMRYSNPFMGSNDPNINTNIVRIFSIEN